MSNTTYQKFVKRWEEVTELPPQSLGPLTPLYKMIVPRFKVMPWLWFIVVSIFVVAVVFIFSRFTVIGATSLLQRGF